LIGWPVWIGAPSQMTNSLPGILRVPHAQESDHRRTVIVLLADLHEQPPIQGDAADGRQMVMRERDPSDWGRPPRCPRSDGHGQPIAAGCVSPDDGAPCGLRPFVSAGQRCSSHWRIAASSRCRARSTGGCRRPPKWRTQRLTWSRWERTPNVRRSTSATRAAVQTSPRNPCACAPRASSVGICARCSGLRRAVMPGGGRRTSASTPPTSGARFSHWLTAPALTPNAAAMAFCRQPCCFKAPARLRRSSRQSAFGGTPRSPVYHGFSSPRRGQ